MPEKVEAMKQMFLVESVKNKNLPIGGGLWSVLYHPEDAPATPYREWTFRGNIDRMPEFAAPKLGKFDNDIRMEVDVPENGEGVLYALGSFSGGLSLYMKDGKLNYEYNLFEIERTRFTSQDRIPAGAAVIEVSSRLAEAKPKSPLNVTIKVNGKEVAGGQVPMTAPLTFTANDCLDVGSDLGSPVSLDYFDEAPFRFNGTVKVTTIKYPE